MADEVGEERYGASEQGHNQQVFAGKLTLDVRRQFTHTHGNFLFANEYAFDFVA